MNILAISGSGRMASTNTALLEAVSAVALPDHKIAVFSDVVDLPVFSPDAENGPLPASVQSFARLIQQSNGLIVSSPEYVRAIPGGLKNAIDWLVSREEIIGKPIALMHASGRGDDMLAQLRLVLSTVSEGFMHDHFLRFDLTGLTANEISQELLKSPNKAKVIGFLQEFSKTATKPVLKQ